MSGHNHEVLFDDDDTWLPPDTFRECVAETEHLAACLLDAMRGHLFVSVPEVEFTARRLHQLAREVHRALPPEVS